MQQQQQQHLSDNNITKATSLPTILAHLPLHVARRGKLFLFNKIINVPRRFTPSLLLISLCILSLRPDATAPAVQQVCRVQQYRSSACRSRGVVQRSVLSSYATALTVLQYLTGRNPACLGRVPWASGHELLLRPIPNT
jgi:hypothetical protein